MQSYVKNAIRCAKYHCKWSGVDYDELLSFALGYAEKNGGAGQLWYKVRLQALDILTKENRRKRLTQNGVEYLILELTMSEYSRSVVSQKRTCLENSLWSKVFNFIKNDQNSDFEGVELEVLKMHYIDNMTQTEITKKLNAGGGVISRRVERANRKLIKHLQENCIL